MTRANLPQALKAYEYIRLPAATHVMTVSAETGELYEMRSDLPEDNYSTWISQLEHLWQWAGGEDLKDQLDRGLLWMSTPTRMHSKSHVRATL